MDLNIELKGGCTRTVLLIGRYAIKIPRLNYGWRLFLQGLLCNMQEVSFSKMNDKRICPVFFYIPGGWLLVMPRCRPLCETEFSCLRINRFWGKDEKSTNGYYGDCMIPVEHKIDSFGWYKWNGGNNTIVAIDYGS
jgi:hypothetical protein